MLSLPGGLHGSAMGASSAGVNVRLAWPSSAPAPTAHAALHLRPLSTPVACSAVASVSCCQATSRQPPNSTAMLPGLMHLRLGALACGGPAATATARGTRTAVRACALAPARASPSSSCSSSCSSTCCTVTGEAMPYSCRGAVSASASTSPAAVPGLQLGGWGLAAPRFGLRCTTGLWMGGRPHAAAPAAASPASASAAVAGGLAPAWSGRRHLTHAPPSPSRRHQQQQQRQVTAHAQAGASPAPDAPGQPGPTKKQQKVAKQAAAAAAAAAQAAAADGAAAGTATVAAAPPPPPSAAARYSPLHYNVEEFCQRVVPSEGERRQRLEVIEAVRAGVRRVWPGARSVELEVFGSFANGLSTWHSDLDLVITGIFEPDRLSGGYEQNEKGRVTAKLRKIAEALTRSKDRGIDIQRQQLIPRARIPILKLWTKSRVTVDVSMGDDSGPRAARYMAQQCRAYPPLKPLVLVLKTYLKACRVNEVNTGGLSSYSLTNMVIAHLQEELKSGHDISDLGETLYTFLLRYGEEHDYNSLAVSVASGGIVPKSSLGFAMESARQAAASMGSHDGAVSWNERLCVDCPLTGRDVSNGTFRIDLVRGAFVQAARKLEALARGRRISDTSLNYLQALFDVNRVLKRQYDPFETQEDEYLKVMRKSDDEEEELAMGGGGDRSDGDGGEGEEDDLEGDYLQERRSPASAATTGRGQQPQRR